MVRANVTVAKMTMIRVINEHDEENEEYDDDDENYFENEAEYGSSDRNSSKDDKDMCDNEHDDDITSKTNTSQGDNGDFSSDNSSSDNDVKPKAKNKKSNGITCARAKKSSQHNKINVRDDMFNNSFSSDLKQEVAENVKKNDQFELSPNLHHETLSQW